MLDFIRSAPWTFAVAAAIFVGAVVGVVYGVTKKGGWKDSGFMLTNDGKHPLQWGLDQLPLTCWVSSDLHFTWLDAFERLRVHVNKVVGRNMLDYGTDIPEGFDMENPGQGNVVFIPGPEKGVGRFHASTTLQWDERTGKLISAVIRLPFPIESEHVWPVILHEGGGHGLGLAHDEHVSSVMHPRIQNRPQGLTQKDIDLLRSTYGEE